MSLLARRAGGQTDARTAAIDVNQLIRDRNDDGDAGHERHDRQGKVKGYESVDYVLEASKGQHMSVSMNTDNASSYFNILAPGESEAAMFIGSTSGNEYKGIFRRVATTRSAST
jgi:hypothetical protein